MEDTCILASASATGLMEIVGKTVVVRTKQQRTSKGVVHTVDPVTKSLVLASDGRCEIFSGINIESVNIDES